MIRWKFEGGGKVPHVYLRVEQTSRRSGVKRGGQNVGKFECEFSRGKSKRVLAYRHGCECGMWM